MYIVHNVKTTSLKLKLNMPFLAWKRKNTHVTPSKYNNSLNIYAVIKMILVWKIGITDPNLAHMGIKPQREQVFLETNI